LQTRASFRYSRVPLHFGRKGSESACRLMPATRAGSHWSRFRVLTLLSLLLIPLRNPAHSGTIRIPFRTVQSLIVVEGRVNGNPAIFLLDTGANRTIVSTKIYGNNLRFQLQRMPHRQGAAGLVGYSLRRPADVGLGQNMWTAQQVSVMDLDELKQMLHMEFDALLGQDFLRQFRSVRIDYHAHVIELQE
jgi:gag-polyprotein putative aspartyl protease